MHVMQQLEDVEAFLTVLENGAVHPLAEVRALFEAREPLVVTRAPGRLDLMGGIADYSGSLVLQIPIAESTKVALQRVCTPDLRVVSLTRDSSARSVSFRMPLDDFLEGNTPITYARARVLFARDPASQWAAYVAGTFLVLMRERGLRFDGGARLLIQSEVPEGKGVSSSAALEVAVMQAIACAWGLDLPPPTLARLCQQVENEVVGAPCGIMDQMTAACGETHRLLALRCQPAELLPSIDVPDDLAVWGLDSGIRHAVSGSDYTAVRIGAFMGYRIIAEQHGFAVRPSADRKGVVIDDPRWQGYLANITPEVFDQQIAEVLPEVMDGASFLERYVGTHDVVTEVDPETRYAVRTPTAHPIYEHARVQRFAHVLQEPLRFRRNEELGQLMGASHASYSACGLGSTGTDRLVELARAAGPEAGIYGAKITGGGSGGTVAILGDAKAGAVVEQIARSYAEESGHTPYLFTGSSPSAASFGHLVLQYQ